MSSQTQQDTATPGARPLRASCDSCSSSKIKCDKEQPSCRRCVASGAVCVYGISRKHGKQAQRKRLTVDHGNSTSQNGPPRARSRSPDNEPTSFEPEPGMSFNDLMQDLNFPLSIDHNVNFEGLLAQHPENSQGLIHVPSSHGTPPENVRNPSQSYNTNCVTLEGINDPAEDVASRTDFTSLDQNSTLLTPTITSTLQPPTPASYCYNAIIPNSEHSLQIAAKKQHHQPHPCYQLACSTMDLLRLEDRFSCAKKRAFDTSARHDTPALTWDQVLHANKTALGTLQQIIDCPCSTRNSHLTFLYSSIISKVIFWYQVAYRIIKSDPSQASARSPPLLTPRASTATSPGAGAFQTPSTPGSATSLPITIGAFDIDAEDRTALAQHLLLSELRKTARLVEQLQAKHGNTEYEGLVDSYIGSADPGSSLRGMLGNYLKSELSKTMREVQG